MPVSLRALALFPLLTLAACSNFDPIGGSSSSEAVPGKPETVVSLASRQLTGIAAIPGPRDDTRLFVSFPRWRDNVNTSVGEVLPGGSIKPYPDARWNAWSESEATSGPGASADKFVCVQSVVGDDRGDLWVLDPASPKMAGVIPGAAKLVHIDPRTDNVVRAYMFPDKVAPKDSYLNDVRIDRTARRAYITDSGRAGLVILDLDTGASRRVLDNHHSTRAEAGVVPIIEGRELRYTSGPNKGKVPQINADGIALDTKRGQLYWQPLTGRRLYRVRTSLLNSPASTDAEIAAGIEDLGRTVMTDGMAIGPDGEILFTAIERNAIMARDPDGKLRTVIQSPLFVWPDSMALGPAGALYITTSQINRTDRFSPGGTMPDTPYLVLKIDYPR